MFKKKNLIKVLVLEGIISSSGRKNLSFKGIQENIDKAFSNKKQVKAVALLINSPGGSASQSEIIANYIKQKSLETGIEVISFVEDVAASGGYFLAVSGKEIYALANTSIVGSIGVLYAGFGFEDFISRYGIKRRIHTAGKNKVILDSFSKEKEEDVEIINELLKETHIHFKEFVKNNRKNIILNEEELFSGKFWIASQAAKLGIIDGIVKDYTFFLKEKFGKNIKIKIIKNKKGLLSSLFKINAVIGKDVLMNIINEVDFSKGIEAVSRIK